MLNRERESQSKGFADFLSSKQVQQKCTSCCQPCRLSERIVSKGQSDQKAGYSDVPAYWYLFGSFAQSKSLRAYLI